MPFIFTYLSILCIWTIMVYVCQLFTMLMVNVHFWHMLKWLSFGKNDIHNVWIHMHRQDHNWGTWIILSYPFTPKAYMFNGSKYLGWQCIPHSTASVIRGLCFFASILWLCFVSHCIWPFIEHQNLHFDKIWGMHMSSRSWKGKWLRSWFKFTKHLVVHWAFHTGREVG